MSASNWLKLLALISLAATGLAVLQWHQTGLPPAPALVRVSLLAFLAALAAGLIGTQTRPRVMLRFLAAVFALVSALALVSDMSLGHGFTSLAGHMGLLAPSLLAAIEEGISTAIAPYAWDPLMTSFLAWPTFVTFALLSAVSGYASRRRHEISIFVN